MDHEFYMKKCFELAKKGRGKVSPNPLVGAIVVKNDKILATGYHKEFGNIHAEVDAINKALKKYSHKFLKDAILYVNIEPCCHFGQNPPCVDIITSYSFKHVIYSNYDPNPLVKSKGKKVLEDFGVKVTSGILEKEGAELNEAYFKFMKKKMPFIILKTALSLNGYITHPQKRYINNEATLKYVHELRNQADAILVGYNTYKKDKPKLTCRIKNGRDPKKIILPSKNISLEKLLHDLAKKNVTSVLVEGGSQVITSFLKQKLADKIILLYASEIYGSQELPYCGELSKMVKLRNIKTKKLEDNIIVEGYVK